MFAPPRSLISLKKDDDKDPNDRVTMSTLNPSQMNSLKIEKLSEQTGLSLEDLASFSAFNRVDDYLALSVSLGFDLDSFFNTEYTQLDFRKITTADGYLHDFFSEAK